MQKPLEFAAIHKESKQILEFNGPGWAYPWEVRSNPDQWQLYIDTRYAAKLRLYRYINGIKPYRPFEGTEIGKTIPILNF